MTLLQVIFELQRPLRPSDLDRLAKFANTYGMKRFRYDTARNQIVIDYDGSRLTENNVGHVLGSAKIAIARKVDPFAEPVGMTG